MKPPWIVLAMLPGNLAGAPLSEARMQGERIAFVAGGMRYEGRVSGGGMQGNTDGGHRWSASRR